MPEGMHEYVQGPAQGPEVGHHGLVFCRHCGKLRDWLQATDGTACPAWEAVPQHVEGSFNRDAAALMGDRLKAVVRRTDGEDPPACHYSRWLARRTASKLLEEDTYAVTQPDDGEQFVEALAWALGTVLARS